MKISQLPLKCAVLKSANSKLPEKGIKNNQNHLE